MGHSRGSRETSPFCDDAGGGSTWTIPGTAGGDTAAQEGTGDTAAPLDPWADITTDSGTSDTGTGGSADVSSPPDAAGLAALLLTTLEAFPSLEVQTGPRHHIAVLWTQTAGEMLSTMSGMTSEGVKIAILVIGAVVLFAPAVKRWKSPPHRSGGRVGDRKDGDTPRDSGSPSGTWAVP